MKRYKKVLIAVCTVLVILLGCITAFLSSDSVRQWIYDEGIKALAEKLHTRIKVKEVEVHFRHGGVALYGFEMDDLNHVTMLKVDTLVVGFKWLPLLHREVDIDGVYLHGAKAVLYKERPDTAANYQFVIDAFKSKKKHKKHALELTAHIKTLNVARADFSWDVKSMPRKGKGKIDGNHLSVRDFHVQMAGDLDALPIARVADAHHDASELIGDAEIRHFSATEKDSGAKLTLKSLDFSTKAEKGTEGELEDMEFSLPGKKFTRLTVNSLKFSKGGDMKDMNRASKVYIHGLNYWTDNHMPRKNVIKPHRGAFDAGHMNMDVDAELTIHKMSKKMLSMTVNSMTLHDKDAGIDVQSLTAYVVKSGDHIFVKKTRLEMGQTRLSMGTAHIMLNESEADSLSKSKVTGITIMPFPVTANVMLSDIAKPFAPVLSNFTTPLKLRVTCCGNLDRILFKNILVTGLNKSLIIHAQGDLCDLTKKQALSLHFWDIQMSSRGTTTEQLVRHFSKKVNLKMQRQMKLIGDIRYTGKFDIVYKKVSVAGTLFTKFGNADFNFYLDGYSKRMIGSMQTTPFDIGKLMNIKHLGPLSLDADFSFVTAKPKGVDPNAKGRLPEGTLSAKIEGAKYGIISLKHITCDVTSDGKTAKGTVLVEQKLRDLVIDVEYHQTVDDQSYKYKVRLQKETAQEKADRKAEKAEAKAARKAAKAAAKAKNN